MLAPTVPRPLGRCPSCHAEGWVGDPCPERICAMRGYSFVPEPGTLGAAPLVENDALIGQRCGDYLLVALLGAGGFGRVYKAIQLPVGMPAAVKLLDTEGGPSGMAALKLAKFEIEAQALARLSHPNIVRLYQYGQHRGAPFLAMELVEDASNLWTEIERRAAEDRPFTLDDVEAILMQVLAALEAAHERQIVHRDVKPENVMLQSVSGHGLFVKVLDFGLAKFTEDPSATSLLLGTPAYMSYEQLTRGPIGPWTDLYALGVLAFELLTGKRPYGGMGVQETLALKLDLAYDPWSRIAHLGYPEELRIFFAHALAIESGARYATAKETRAGLALAIAALREGGADFLTIPTKRLVESTPIPYKPTSALEPVQIDPTRRLARPPSDKAPEGELPPRVDGVPLPVTTAPTRSVSEPRSRAAEGANVRTGVLEQVPAPPSGSRRWGIAVALAAAAAIGLVIFFASRGDTPGQEPRPGAPVEATAPGSAAPEQGFSGEPNVRVLAGTFARGSAPHDPDHRDDESLQEVVLGRSLVVRATEVTQAEWSALFPTQPSTHRSCGPTCPVENVSWWDAVAFANALSDRQGLPRCYSLAGCRGAPGDGQFACGDARFEGLDCTGWRLPTEAEWEYLARAQSLPGDLGQVAWYPGNADVEYGGAMPCMTFSGRRVDRAGSLSYCGPHPVGTMAKNAFGIHDLIGNVREWVHDAYGEYPAKDRVRDPLGPGGEGDRVVRGGSFRSELALLRAAARDHAPLSTHASDLGFRVVRSLP